MELCKLLCVLPTLGRPTQVTWLNLLRCDPVELSSLGRCPCVVPCYCLNTDMVASLTSLALFVTGIMLNYFTVVGRLWLAMVLYRVMACIDRLRLRLEL